MINRILRHPGPNIRKLLISKLNFHQSSFLNDVVRPSTIRTPEIVHTNYRTKYVPGNSYQGFLCTQAEYIEDFNMTAYTFRHENVGTEYLHIDRNDANNVFSINFRTTPMNSKGIPHILEHTVLCGSVMYPVRDPFFKMLTRSVATFMNATTAPDCTMYPFSSCNETDFHNLQKIYLDAVFRPNLRHADFKQEGWRLEHKDINDKKSEYMFRGVVFNEMKGVYASNNNIFGEKILNTVLPDHTYGYNSGGDPIEIPNLTHGELVEFHEKFYHPSNSRIFSYGNNNLEPTLKYINETYMKDFMKIETDYSKIPSQKRWNDMKKLHVSSRFDNMGAPIEKQNQIAITYLMTDITDIYETFVMTVLTELLVRGPNSYFYKSLIEPNISGGYNQMTGFEGHIKDTLFVVGLQDLLTDDFEKVESIFNKTIDDVIRDGFDKNHIESVLHNFEIHLRHQTPKFGLGLLYNLAQLWIHDGDIISGMKVSKLIKQFRDNLASNPTYLQDKVEHYFRKNNHKLILTMSPDMEYENKINQMENDLLTKKISELNDSDKDQIYRDGIMLSNLQKASENLEVLPCLKLSDIPIEVEKYNMNLETMDGISTQICTADTNGVAYYRGIFDASTLNPEQLSLLPLFTAMINQFGTTNYPYREFDQLIQMKTSGINFSINFSENLNDNRKYEVGVLFGAYCLLNNNHEMFNIFKEILINHNMNDVARFEMLLDNYVSSLSVGIVDSGHMYAVQSSSGLISEASKLKESMMGIEHISIIKNLIQTNSKEEILSKLREIGNILFDKNKLRSALNVENYEENNIKSNYINFIKNLPKINKTNNQIWNNSELLTSSSLHHVIDIPVNYCAKSIFTVPYLHEDFAPLQVLAKILSSKYLHPVVREQNGAYGSGAQIGTSGIFSFYSYRDPNSIITLDVFNKSANWFEEALKNNVINDQILFEAKLGVIQKLDAPLGPGDKGMLNFKHGLTQEIFAKHRSHILSVTRSELEMVNKKYLNNQELIVGQCILGPENQEILDSTDHKWTINKPNEK